MQKWKVIPMQESYLINGSQVSFAQFLLTDLEAVVGLDRKEISRYSAEVLLPGDWKSEGQFSGLAIVEILAYHLLREVGFLPEFSDAASWRYAKAILWYALSNERGVFEISGGRRQVYEILAALRYKPEAAGQLIGLSISATETSPLIDVESAAAELMENIKRPLFSIEIGNKDPDLIKMLSPPFGH